MKKNSSNNFIQKTQEGYAILFAVVVVSIISMLAIGLSNTTYKQLVLSSLANDSQISYYQSDTATECALYADNVLAMTSASPSPWECGVDANNQNFSFTISNPSGGASDYTLTSSLEQKKATIPCFNFNVSKKLGGSPVSTVIDAYGYNSCDKTNQKTVEREIEVTY